MSSNLGLYLAPIFLFWNSILLHSQSISNTFSMGDIWTSFGSYQPNCDGPEGDLSITLPQGGPWSVTGVDITYNMTAQNGGWKSHQRSNIRFQNTATVEDSIYQGVGDIGGVQIYNRTGISIANGNYSGNTILNFEMRAWRTSGNFNCSPSENPVDNFTWIITVHYSPVPEEGSIGIGTVAPTEDAILDLTSTTQAFLPPRMTTQQRDAIGNPVPGMMIFNTTTQKLDIYTIGWSPISFTLPGVRKLYGGDNVDRCRSIQKTNDGGFIVAGYSLSSNSGTLTGLINNGSYDYWVLKLNNSGNIVWQKLLGGSQSEYANSIQQTSDGGFIIGGHSTSTNSGTLMGLTNHGFEDYWIVKLDATGIVLWQKLLGGSFPDFAVSIQETNDSGFIVAGYTYSSNTGTLLGLINNGGVDCWIIKLDSNGNLVWQKIMGGSSDDYPGDIQQTSNNGFIMTGYSASSNTGTLQGIYNNGGDDYWILKLDEYGNIIWQDLIGGDQSDKAYSGDQTSDGGLIVAGFSFSSGMGPPPGLINNGITDHYILKLDDVGNIMWEKLIGGSQLESAFSIQQMNEGGYFVSGNSNSSNTGNLSGISNNGSIDYWVYKLDSAGTIIWQRLLGGSQDETIQSMQITSDGGVILAGTTNSSNTGTLTGFTNNGLEDFWILKLDANGNPY